MLSNKLKKSLLVAPAVFGASVIASTAAIANEVQPSVSDLDLLNQYSAEGQTNDLSQVTSVSQLSDVQPTDWAFQALQSLVERYGCIAGYPDGTYRGNRAMTRYEFAAGLNACLDRVNELIAAGLADKVSREDLAVLQRLQEEFAAELAALRGRVDALEARVAELEANQFSTTTKLGGEVIFAQEFAFDQSDFDDQATFGYRVRLNFDTSFTGEDLLRTRFQARDLPEFEMDFIGRSFGGGGGGDFVLDDLVYVFPAFDSAEVIVGANSISCDDFVASTISPLDSASSGSVSDFGFPRQYAIACDGSAGLGAIFQLTESLSLDVGYSAGDAASPLEGEGLFNGQYSIIGQLTYLGDFVDAAFTYVNSYFPSSSAISDLSDKGESTNTYGGQINFKINDTFELGGGIAYVNVQSIGGAPDFEAWSWQGTIAVNDLLGEGNQLGIVAGVPDYSLDGTFIEGDDNSFMGELYYRYQLNDNISLTPSVVVITDPLNDTDNTTGVIGHLRTTFKF